jgi:hypothetical protein
LSFVTSKRESRRRRESVIVSVDITLLRWMGFKGGTAVSHDVTNPQ